MRRVVQTDVLGGGIDYYSKVATDIDDTMRFRLEGDPYPRVIIDPHGALSIGSGSVVPSVVGAAGGGGSGAPAYDVRNYGVYPTSDPRFVSAAANSFLFAVNLGTITTAADFVFGPGTYPNIGFSILHSGQRIVGAGGISNGNGDLNAGTILRMDSATASGCVNISGPDTGGGYGNRLFGCGVKRTIRAC